MKIKTKQKCVGEHTNFLMDLTSYKAILQSIWADYDDVLIFIDYKSHTVVRQVFIVLYRAAKRVIIPMKYVIVLILKC